ncbi:MAG: transcriptional repressor [Mariprofundaceae bacterium]|nr:transcriptional repressor [Mariprofundaceae bacterium]
MKLTAHRETILKFINASNAHWDAEELARALADSGKAIGIATVYRGLAALDEAGLISSVQLGDRKRYECAEKTHHDHLVCTECGAIEEFVQTKIERLQEQVARENGFKITGHQLLIFGLCGACQNV